MSNLAKRDSVEIFVADERSEAEDGVRTLNVLLVVDGAALGFGSLDTTPGLLIAISLICLVFAHLFLFFRSRLEIDNIRYEAAFKSAPPTHAVHKLTAAKDHASGLAGCSAFFLTLAATSFLCVGMIDQFTQSEFIPTLPENAVVLLLGFVAITLLAILIWLFSRHEVTLENFE